jgi:hypothetical protein
VFVPGAEYVATLQISGAGDRDLIVQLMARADAHAETESAPPSKPSRSKTAGSKKRKAPPRRS